MSYKPPKIEKRELTLDEVVNAYNSTAKRTLLEVTEVMPNHCMCLLKRLHKPLTNTDGQAIILPETGEDELVFEVIKAGAYNNDNYFEAKKGDLIVVKDASPIRFSNGTKYVIDGVEYPVFHMVSNANILLKVAYSKL